MLLTQSFSPLVCEREGNQPIWHTLEETELHCRVNGDVTKTGNGEWEKENGKWKIKMGNWKWEIEYFFALTFYNVE